MTIKRLLFQYLERLLEIVFPKKKHSSAAQAQGTAILLQKIQPIQNRGHLAFLPYHDPAVKHFLYAIKYERHQESVTFAADILREHICGETQEEEIVQKMHYALCAVPATEERKRHNGYNHLHTLFDALYQNMPNTAYLQDKRDLLGWTRKVSRQSKLKSRTERYNNVSGAMIATEQISPNMICFVVDDVTTTGSTLTEAHRALAAAGANTVITLALAH